MMILDSLRIYFHEFCELCNSAVGNSFIPLLAVLDDTTVEFVIVISGGSRISPRRRRQLQGGPTYDFAKISQKLHEIERIWAPLRSATGYFVDDFIVLMLIDVDRQTSLSFYHI